MATYSLADFRTWLHQDIGRYGNVDTSVEFAPTDPFDLAFHIYTETNRFRVVVREARDGKHSYLGCTSTCRKPRAGEDWTRGSDLADGPLEPETWHRILADIVSYEIQKIHRPRWPVAAPGDHNHVWRAAGGEGTGHGSIERQECCCGARRTIEYITAGAPAFGIEASPTTLSRPLKSDSDGHGASSNTTGAAT